MLGAATSAAGMAWSAGGLEPHPRHELHVSNANPTPWPPHSALQHPPALHLGVAQREAHRASRRVVGHLLDADLRSTIARVFLGGALLLEHVRMGCPHRSHNLHHCPAAAGRYSLPIQARTHQGAGGLWRRGRRRARALLRLVALQVPHLGGGGGRVSRWRRCIGMRVLCCASVPRPHHQQAPNVCQLLSAARHHWVACLQGRVVVRVPGSSTLADTARDPAMPSRPPGASTHPAGRMPAAWRCGCAARWQCTRRPRLRGKGAVQGSGAVGEQRAQALTARCLGTPTRLGEQHGNPR